MKRTSLHSLFAGVSLLAFVISACGGSEPPPKEPESVATPHPTEGAKTPAGGAGPMVTPGEIREANPPPAPATSASAPMRAEGPCDLCAGKVTAELQADLTKRASDARPCYVKVLTNEPQAKASMTIEVKVGRDGSACGVQAKVDEPSYPGLADCVMTEYKKGAFSPPGAASCVVAHVPIVFTPAK